MSRHSFLREVNDRTDRWSIVVRVFRKWNVYQKASPSELFCTTMILLDAEGTKIQASIIPKNSNNTLCQDLVEGKTYFIANFVVSQNSTQYKATTHQFKILFTQQTFAREEPANIPLHAYSFLSISEILNYREQNFTDYLISLFIVNIFYPPYSYHCIYKLYLVSDVVAFVKAIGSLEEYRRDNETKNNLQMLLIDIVDNDIECILFDECSTDAYMDQLQNMETPVVVVINLARIAFTDEGKASFNTTRVFFNPPLQEVKAERAKDRASPITTTISQVMPSQSSQQSSSSILKHSYRVSVADIPNQKIGESFVVNCLIQKLETQHGWTYDGCSKCACKPRDEANILFCPNCKKKPEIIEPKLKVHYIVSDETGSDSIVFWDKLASQLLQKLAAELKQILISDQREYDFPDQCDSVVGKRLLLKLKRNEFNAKHSGSSISVQQFIHCEDLNEQFNQVVADVSDGPNLNETSISHEPVVEVATSHNATADQATSMKDNTNEPIHSSRTAAIPPKGKRKAHNKRTIVDQGTTTERQHEATLNANDRILKVVKQEK